MYIVLLQYVILLLRDCCVHPSGSQLSTLALGEVEVAAPVWDVLEVAAAAAVVAAFARPVALDLGTSRWNLHINHHRNRINSVTFWFFFMFQKQTYAPMLSLDCGAWTILVHFVLLGIKFFVASTGQIWPSCADGPQTHCGESLLTDQLAGKHALSSYSIIISSCNWFDLVLMSQSYFFFYIRDGQIVSSHINSNSKVKMNSINE